MGPIARKLVARACKSNKQKVLELSAFAASLAHVEVLDEAVATDEQLAELEPAHALLVYVHNELSGYVEQLSEQREMSRLVELISKAEDEYMPSGPPMSPLTRSYFTCWSMFDAWVGNKRETMASCVLALGEELGMHPAMLRLIGLMQASRMGLYEHRGTGIDDELVLLRELVTGAECRALSPSGYLGDSGELWLARVLPAPGAVDGDEPVVFTTPYVIVHPGLEQWRAYLERTIGKLTERAARGKYERLMKYGPKPSYWSEYIFEAYLNHDSDVIRLVGLPDIDTSRPHARVNW